MLMPPAPALVRSSSETGEGRECRRRDTEM